MTDTVIAEIKRALRSAEYWVWQWKEYRDHSSVVNAVAAIGALLSIIRFAIVNFPEISNGELGSLSEIDEKYAKLLDAICSSHTPQ